MNDWHSIESTVKRMRTFCDKYKATADYDNAIGEEDAFNIFGMKSKATDAVIELDRVLGNRIFWFKQYENACRRLIYLQSGEKEPELQVDGLCEKMVEFGRSSMDGYAINTTFLRDETESIQKEIAMIEKHKLIDYTRGELRDILSKIPRYAGNAHSFNDGRVLGCICYILSNGDEKDKKHVLKRLSKLTQRSYCFHEKDEQ